MDLSLLKSPLRRDGYRGCTSSSGALAAGPAVSALSCAHVLGPVPKRPSACTGWWSSGGDVNINDVLFCQIDSQIPRFCVTLRKHCRLNDDTAPSDSPVWSMNLSASLFWLVTASLYSEAVSDFSCLQLHCSACAGQSICISLGFKQSSFLSLGTRSTWLLLCKRIWNCGHFFKDEHLLY